tara:strand:+ start:2074 stop:3099 length:1026 start_codon:yes stop_codon:yes gene_type:complete
MIKFLFFLLPFFCSGQIYKYATIYAGGSVNAIAPPVETYNYVNGELIETTNEDQANYRYFIGIKKISRYKHEKKPKFYYDGTEQNASVYRSPIDRFEYLLQYEIIQNFGDRFENRDFWLRYLGNFYSVKLQQSVNGYIDLQYKAVDLRLKHDFKDIRATIGVVLRNSPVYGVNAFKSDYPEYNNFFATINQLGYFSESSWIDSNFNGYFDRWEQAQTLWLNMDGDTITNSTAQMENIYSEIVGDYNRQWSKEQGNQNTLSGVVGLSYYKHFDMFFVLLYGNYFFKTYQLTEYASKSNDYDFGVTANLKLTKSFSFYTQLNYLNYFNRENYTINLGINLIII